jgi:hypothetical protein
VAPAEAQLIVENFFVTPWVWQTHTTGVVSDQEGIQLSWMFLLVVGYYIQ